MISPRIQLIALAALVLMLSVVMLGLTGSNVQYRYQTTGPLTATTDGASETLQIARFPEDLNIDSTWCFFARGCGGAVDAVLTLVILIFGRNWSVTSKFGKRTGCFYPLLYFVCVACIIRSTVTVVYGFVQHYQSSTLDPAAFKILGNSGSSVYEYPRTAAASGFDLASWNCQIRNIVVGDQKSRLGSMCIQMEAARIIAIILAVAESTEITWVWWMQKKDREATDSTVRKESAESTFE